MTWDNHNSDDSWAVITVCLYGNYMTVMTNRAMKAIGGL